MALLAVVNKKGETISEVELNDAVFGVPVNNTVLNAVIRQQLMSRRSGTASVKNRSDVNGSTRKLYRQKGTGRARRGDIKSPLLRGGGVIFGPKPRSYAYALPKKVRRLALKMALSAKMKDAELTVIDNLDFERIKTKDFVNVLRALDMRNVLFVIDQEDRNFELSTRNVQNIKVLRKEGLNVYDILKYRNLVLLEASIKGIEGRLIG